VSGLELWIRKIMGKENVAIFSADRKQVQGKKPNIIGRTFGSKKQPGKINTFTVGPTIGPQNPGSNE
jgi:hypothetical protein